MVPSATEVRAGTPDPASPSPGTSRTGLRRLVGITVSLVGTHAATSVLGLLFWSIAARQYSLEAVGVAGAAVALMGLLATLGTLGLGTLLIARLPRTVQGERRVLVRTALVLAATTTAVLAVVVPLVMISVLGAENLRPVAGAPSTALLFAVGTALMAAAMVLDQAVLVLGSGSLQLERNIIASATKVGVLVALGLAGGGGGMVVFAAWTVGTLVSLPWVSWRTRGGRPLQGGRRLVDHRALRGLGRTALSHHALNTTLQAPLLLLPILVTVVLSAAENGIFTSALQITGLVFALPYAVTVSLFAAAEGDEATVLSRMRQTIPFGLGVSIAANVALIPLAPVILSAFGPGYAADGPAILRLLALAGVPFVVKDHYVALRRVQGRMGEATGVLGAFLALEVAGALIGALLGATEGLCIGWLLVLAVEAVVLGAVLLRQARQPARRRLHESAQVAAALVQEHVQEPAHEPAQDLDEEPAGGPAPGGSTRRAQIRREDLTQAPREPAGPRRRPLQRLSPTRPPRLSLTRPQRLSPTRPPRLSLTRPQRLSPTRPPRLALAPAVALMAAGLMSMSLAALLGRSEGSPGASVALWVLGLVLIFTPGALVVMLPGTPRRDRVVAAVLMPLALQVSRFVLYPDRFAFHDELIHANVLRQILESGALYSDNPLLPVTSFYPGMEVATAGLASITGLAAHPSSVVVLLAVRVVMSLSLMGIVEHLTGSTRMAATASVVYVCNPQWLFFNSQYSYQTFALPLAVMTVYLIAVRRPGGRGLLLPAACLLAVVYSHHVTAGLLVVALSLWAALELVLRWRRGGQAGVLAVMAAVGALALVLSVLNPGNTLASYLGAIGRSSQDDVETLAATGEAKPLFQNSAGIGSEPWEQVLMVVSVLVTLLVLMPALIRALAWLRARVTLAVLLCLVALLYPLVPGGHLTRATAEVGDRAAGFAFLGVAFVLGWWLWQRWVSDVRALVVAAVATVVFLGSVVLGAGPFAGQLPGAYRVSADARSVDSYNLAASRWMATGLPSGSRVYGDRVGGLLAAAVGRQYTVRHISTEVDASRLLLDPQFGQADVEVLREADIRYVIADRRNAYSLPNQDVYIESGEFGGDGRKVPVAAEALRKFDQVPGVDRIYDNGAVSIYDVGVLTQ